MTNFGLKKGGFYLTINPVSVNDANLRLLQSHWRGIIPVKKRSKNVIRLIKKTII